MIYNEYINAFEAPSLLHDIHLNNILHRMWLFQKYKDYFLNSRKIDLPGERYFVNTEYWHY